MIRTLDSHTLRNVALVCLADGVVGVSFGAIAVSSGLPIWLPMLLSVLVFAGSSQFIFVGLVASGGNPFAAMAAGLLVNSRHVPFGFSVADVVDGPWWKRILGSHLMTDESVAFTLAQNRPEQRRAVYWTCAVSLFVVWNLGVIIGAFTGTLITNTSVFGLDAAFPAVLIALLLPSIKDVPLLRAALLGAVVALVSAPFLPVGVPILLSLTAVVAAWPKADPKAEPEPELDAEAEAELDAGQERA